MRNAECGLRNFEKLILDFIPHSEIRNPKLNYAHIP